MHKKSPAVGMALVGAGCIMRVSSEAISTAMAVQNLLLQAHASGLGAVWMGYPNLAASQIGAWLGEGGELQATIALGYPSTTPRPGRRKPLHSVVRWEG
jgi:nitroreductase